MNGTKKNNKTLVCCGGFSVGEKQQRLSTALSHSPLMLNSFLKKLTNYLGTYKIYEWVRPAM